MKKRDDLYIAIIRFGEGELEEGGTFDDLKQHIKTSYKIDEDRLKRLVRNFYEIVSPITMRIPSTRMFDPDVMSTLRTEAYFSLLDYTELHEAR